MCNADFIIVFGRVAIGRGWCHIYEGLKKFHKEMIRSYAMEDRRMARGRNKMREHGQGDKLKYTCVGCWIKIVVVIVSFVMLIVDRLRHIMYFEILWRVDVELWRSWGG